MNHQPGFECTVCMESLNNPAPPSPVAGSNEKGLESGRTSGTGAAVNNVSLSSKGRKKVVSEKAPDTPEYLSEICGTWCGHLFHKACLDRWFLQTGKKKNCPSCRKAITTTKIIRMYLPRSMSEEHLSSADSSLPSCNCSNEECRQVLSIHEILVNEFNELKSKHVDLVDDNQVLKAEKASLEEELERMKNENAASTANNGSVAIPGTSKRSAPISAVPGKASVPKSAKKEDSCCSF